jgi:hypothetical protein
MRRSTRTAAGLLTLALALGTAGAREPADAAVTLRPVKYSELQKIIRDQKGKVLLVDFWAEY